MFDNTDIFQYECDMDGNKKFADPLVISKKINKTLGGDDLDQLFKNATIESDSPHAKQLISDSEDRLIELTRKVFNLQPINEDTGKGITDARSLKILIEFMVWLSNVKKNIETTQNAAEPSQDTLIVSPLPTKNMSDSTSIAVESETLTVLSSPQGTP